MAKQVTLIPKEDLQSLVKILESNIKALESGEIDSAIESLKKLKSNIERNLNGGKIDVI
jgi:flagellar biosynthesis/type III secretory pathway chaperone